MKYFADERGRGKTTELFEWIARGEPVMIRGADDEQLDVWSRVIIVGNEQRRRSARRALQQFANMQFADPPRYWDYIHTVEEIHSARGQVWYMLRSNVVEFALDDADDLIRTALGGVAPSVITMSAQPYEREAYPITPPDQLSRPTSTRDEDLFTKLSLRKGFGP